MKEELTIAEEVIKALMIEYGTRVNYHFEGDEDEKN